MDENPPVAGNRNLVGAEYFFDQDPGLGLGTPLTVLPDGKIMAQIEEPNLEKGFHRLYIRYRDNANKWGIYESRHFYMDEMAPAVGKQKIIGAEYFFNQDPGVGNGISLPVHPNGKIIAEIDMVNFSLGFHRMYVRYLDDKGDWGLYENRLFYVDNQASPQGVILVDRVEYFFDNNDPGEGNGIALPFQVNTLLKLEDMVIVSGLSVGDHTLHLRIRNTRGNWSTVEVREFTVQPSDEADPPIPDEEALTEFTASCTVSLNDLAIPTATDAVDGLIQGTTDAIFPITSTTTITWTYTNSSGNSSTQQQNIIISDTEAPVIEAPVDLTVTSDNGLCSASAINLGNAITSDNCTVASIQNDAPEVFPIGETVVTWTVTDGSGNTANATQLVIVQDQELPVILAPNKVVLNLPTGSTEATAVNLGIPEVSDNCAVASVTNDAPESFPLGTTTITWTVVDASGNSATAVQLVEINVSEPPVDCDAGEKWTEYFIPGANDWRGITYGNGKFVGVSLSGTNRVMNSADGMNWTFHHAAEETNQWSAVTFGDGKFVAVANAANGNNNYVMSSTDGEKWSAHEVLDLFIGFNAVAYGNGRFVAVSNFVYSSTDGINWSRIQLPQEALFKTYYAVTYGDGKFVAVSPDVVITSTDGVNWQAYQTPESNSWESVTYGNGKFVAVAKFGNANRVMVSTDGANWNVYQVPESNAWWAVTYGNGRFVAVANSVNRVMNSYDGINWTIHEIPSASSWWSIAFGGGKFVAGAIDVNGGSRVMVSECTPLPTVPAAPSDLIAAVADGLVDISFTQGDDGGSPILNYEYSLAGGDWTAFASSPLMLKGLVNGQEYSISLRAVNAVGKGEASEVSFIPIEDCFSGQYWTAYPATEANFWSSITYGNGRFVAVSRDGQHRVMSSTNGIEWTPSSATEPNAWNSVTFGNGRFVAVSRDGANRVMSSTDGVNWISGTGTSINSSQWNAVTYGNGRFVAVATGGTNRIMSSTDGINWSLHQAPEVNSWWSVTYGNGKYVAVGSLGTNRVMVSLDGINWTAHQAAAESFWFSVTYGNGQFVAIALGGETQVMNSEDGINWTAQEVPESTSWSSVTFGLGKFIAVLQNGIDNGLTRVMSSPDGKNWTAYKAAEPNAWFTVGYGGGKFVALSRNGENRVMISDCTIPSAELAAPTRLLAYPTDRTVEIEFAAPYDGVDPITNYEYSLDNGESWTPLNQDKLGSPVTITDLTNNTEYSIALRAVNSQGPGAMSLTIKAKPEACFAGQVWEGKMAAGGSDSEWTSVVYGNGKFVALADWGATRAMSSQDGIQWTANQVPQLNGWSSVTFGNGKFVAVAYDGANRVMNSTDGITWTTHSAAEANNWTSVTYGDGKFVAVAPSGANRVMTSTDGIIWVAHEVSGSPYAITFGNGRFVAVGDNSVMSSTDGRNWTIHTSPESNYWTSVTYGNGRFVAISRNGNKQVMSSLDGMNWTSHDTPSIRSWNSIGFGDGRFLAVATDLVMSSQDGIYWSAHKATGSNYWSSVAYGDNKFVAVSWYGDNKVMVSSCPGAPDEIVPDEAVLPDVTAQCLISFEQLSIPTATDKGGNILQGTTDTSIFPITAQGTTIITWTYEDQVGNSFIQTQIISIEDTIAPIVNPKNLVIEIEEGRSESITPEEVDAGSTDNCGPVFLSLDKNTFTAADEGNNTITLTATDAVGNTSSQEATVTIIVIRPPCKVIALANNLTVALDKNGQASITTRQVNNGSYSECIGGTLTLGLSRSTFNCADVGVNEVTLTATDRNGNVGSTVFTVTVVDNLAPTIAKLPNTLRVSIEANGSYSVPDFRVTYPASDNCTVATYTQTPAPGTVYTTAGTYPVVLTATDQSGNVTSGTFDISLSVARPKGGGGNKSIDMNAVLKVSWNTPFAEIAQYELLIRDEAGKDRSLKVNWNQGDYNPLRPGLYHIKGKLYEETSFRMTSEPMMFVLVEQKPLPKDILLSNNIIAKKAVNGFEIGSLTTIDPADDIHIYSMDENESVQLIQNKLVWVGKGEIPASLKVNVHSMDRAGQLISSTITLYREVVPNSILIYPNPAKTETNILVQLYGESEVGIRIYDSVGRLVYSEQESQHQAFVRNLDLKGLASGVYHVVVQIDSKILNGRLVKDL